MIDSEGIFLYQILVNLVTLAFFIKVFRTLPPSSPRLWFSLVSLFFLVYANLLCVFYFPITNPYVATYFSKGIFAVSILYTSAVVHLLFLLCNPKAIEKFHYKIFQLSQAFFFVTSLTSLVQNGVRAGEDSFDPIRGPLYLYFIISYLFWWAYAFIIAFAGFRKQDNPVLRKQAGAMVIAVFLIFSLTLLSNGLLPAIYGSSQLSLLGSLWFLFLIIGIGIILMRGKAHNMKHMLMDLNDAILNSNSNNQLALHQTLLHISNAFDGASFSFKKKVSLNSNDGSKTSLYISRLNKKDDEILDISKTIPMKWIEGMIDNMTQLERDNFGLALGLQKVMHTDPYIFNGEIAKYLPDWMQEALDADGVTKLLTADMALQTNFSPLEISEKRVIMHYLAKNKYNKNRTRLDLGITINTLNAKIQKFGIHKSKKDFKTLIPELPEISESSKESEASAP